MSFVHVVLNFDAYRSVYISLALQSGIIAADLKNLILCYIFVSLSLYIKLIYSQILLILATFV